jgi:hypothetical protein
MYTIWYSLILNSNLAFNVSNKELCKHILLKINVCNTKFHFENCALLGYYAASTATCCVITLTSAALSYSAVET